MKDKAATRTLCDIFNIILSVFQENKIENISIHSEEVDNKVGENIVSSAPTIKINKDTIIRNKWHSGYERTKPVIWFVIHGTAGGGTLHWIRNIVKENSQRGKAYKKGIGLFHYLIERDGTIWEVINPDKWIWHASIGSFDGGTIGVELLNPSYKNTDSYTSQQYDSLLNLYNYLRSDKYPEMDVMISHNRAKIKINNGKYGGKACPGPGFDWTLWKNMVGELYSYNHNGGESLWHITSV
jgi:hypothetical protein